MSNSVSNSQAIEQIEDLKDLIDQGLTTIETAFNNKLVDMAEARDNNQKLQALKDLLRRLGESLSKPFSENFEEDKANNMFKYARNSAALQDIVRLLSESKDGEINVTENVESLITALNKIREETFRKWSQNLNKEAMAEESKIQSRSEQIKEEIDALVVQGISREGLEEVRDAGGTIAKCNQCGRFYLKNYKNIPANGKKYGHDHTDLHKKNHSC